MSSYRITNKDGTYDDFIADNELVALIEYFKFVAGSNDTDFISYLSGINDLSDAVDEVNDYFENINNIIDINKINA